MATLARLLTTLLRRSPPGGEPPLDADLLARFAKTRDAAAFELLVWRHGAMVLGTCRRMLRHEQSAEDAFQTVFLILAKKAGSVRTQLAGWLHTTARRVCLRFAKRTPFAALEAEPPAAVPPDASDPELAALLDAEVARLPEKFRLAVILCYLRGLTTEQAAEHLGIPKGTVLSRLATARKRLVERLTAKGVTVPAAFLTTALATPELSADVGGRLTTAAIGFVTSKLPITVPSQLATEVLNMTTQKSILAVAVAVVLTAAAGTGVGWALADGDKPGDGAKPAAKAKPEPNKAEDDPNIEIPNKRLVQQREKLVAAIVELERQVARLTAERQKRAAEAGSDPERKANEELLVEVVRQAFAAETALMEAEFELKEAMRAYEPIRARKAGLEKAKAEVADLDKKENAARDEYDKMAKVLTADSPRLKDAKAALEAIIDKRQEALRRKDELEQSAPRLPPRSGRFGGGGGGLGPVASEQQVKEYEQQLAAEEAKRAAVERGESVVRMKQAKCQFLRQRHMELKARLSEASAPPKLQEFELDQAVAQLRTLKEMLLAVELQLNGVTLPAQRGEEKFEQLIKLIEELRREVKKLQAERK